MPRNDLTSLGRLGAKCCNLTSTRSRRHVPSHDSHRPVSLEGGGRVVPMRHEIRLCRLFRAEKGFPPSREALASAHHLDAACTCVLWLGANCGLRRWQATDGLSRAPTHPHGRAPGEERDTNCLQQGSTYTLLTSTTTGGRSLHSTICE